MASGSDHRRYAAAVAFGASAGAWSPNDHWSKHPIVTACIAAGCGTLPDIFEPAHHPNHRQFFHSIVFAVGVGFLMKDRYQCEPETELGEVGRQLMLVAAGAYLVHLAMDFATPKSLPLLGK